MEDEIEVEVATDDDGAAETQAVETAAKTRTRATPKYQRGRAKRAYVRRTAATPAPARDAMKDPAGRAEPNREPAAVTDLDDEAAPRRRQFKAGGTGYLGFLPAHRKKPGWDYEFKTMRVYNQQVDPSDLAFIASQGWRPEKARDWPELVPPGWQHDYVEVSAQILYSRPMSLTMEARAEALAEAQDQRNNRTRAAAAGRLSDNHGSGIATAPGMRVVTTHLEVEEEVGRYA